MRMTDCKGCGKEMKPDEPMWPQKDGREWYCKACTKRYPTFVEKSKPIYDEIDKLRDAKLVNVRKEVFGLPVYEDTGATYRKEEVKIASAASSLSGGNTNAI